jgi:hypothetical protein
VDLQLEMEKASATWKWDAIQFEPSSRRAPRPTQWKRSPAWAIDPLQIQPGALTVRGAGETEHGIQIYQETFTETIASGATYTTTATPVEVGRAVLAVTGRVTTDIGGATSFTVGPPLNATRYGLSVLVAANTTFSSISDGSTGPSAFIPGERIESESTGLGTYSGDQPLLFTAEGGNFNGTGAVKFTVHYISVTPPTG